MVRESVWWSGHGDVLQGGDRSERAQLVGLLAERGGDAWTQRGGGREDALE
jgi:hypothetical protein